MNCGQNCGQTASQTNEKSPKTLRFQGFLSGAGNRTWICFHRYKGNKQRFQKPCNCRLFQHWGKRRKTEINTNHGQNCGQNCGQFFACSLCGESVLFSYLQSVFIKKTAAFFDRCSQLREYNSFFRPIASQDYEAIWIIAQNHQNVNPRVRYAKYVSKMVSQHLSYTKGHLGKLPFWVFANLVY